MRGAAALILALAALAPGGVAASESGLERLVRAYPDHLARTEGDTLVWRDGTRMPAGSAAPPRRDEEALAAPNVADIFRHPYPAGAPAGEPATDPGRFRPAALFEKIYGGCADAGFAARLVPVRWLPRHGGGTVRVTPVNGVDRRLQAVSDALDYLPERFMAFLKPSAGTFNCRKIAGTDQASAHGYGIAIDIATASADYWRWSPNGRYRNRVPQEIVDVFERHGFIWGGKWKHFDTMHFEYRPELLP